MLNAYLTATRQLLQNPSAPVQLYADADLVIHINTARQQLAGESASLKVLGSLALIVGFPGPYAIEAITPTFPVVGVGGALNVRMVRAITGGAKIPITPRPWPWFQQYNSDGATGPTPTEWAQYGEGVDGTLFFHPAPSVPLSVELDTINLPTAVLVDADPEALPLLWTDAVPYYAAYQALLAAQTGARVQDAERMFQIYERFVRRARIQATPDVVPIQYPKNTAIEAATKGGG